MVTACTNHGTFARIEKHSGKDRPFVVEKDNVHALPQSIADEI